jgi:hypothetical protein
MSPTVWLIVPLFATVSCFAQSAVHSETEKPACTERIRGKLWPEKAARTARVPVEICAPKRWKYRWQQITIDVSQLRNVTKRKTEIAAVTAVLPVVGKVGANSVRTPPD